MKCPLCSGQVDSHEALGSNGRMIESLFCPRCHVELARYQGEDAWKLVGQWEIVNINGKLTERRIL